MGRSNNGFLTSFVAGNGLIVQKTTCLVDNSLAKRMLRAYNIIEAPLSLLNKSGSEGDKKNGFNSSNRAVKRADIGSDIG